MVKKDLENILKELQAVFEDIKAEVVVSEILENSRAKISDFTIQNKSIFKRPYRRDILDYKESLSDVNNFTLNLNLSRNGIYDSLPEGVFHNFADPALKKLSYQKKREKQKKQEKEARRFFQPIENELFHQYVEIEKNERGLIDKFSDIKNNFLLKFWQIEDGMPAAYVIKLIKLLPYVHRISGNLELTALCLEMILEEEVTLYKKNVPYSIVDKNKRAGKSLGVDLVLGVEESTILCPEVEAVIGPVSNKNIENFIPGTPTMKFLDFFFDYLMPMELKVTTKIEFARNKDNFVLSENEPAIMGLTTAL